MKGKKVTFTDDDLQYIRDHYADTHNEELAAHFNCGWRTIVRRAAEMGLKKSPEFMRQCQRHTAEAAKNSHLRHGTYPPKGFVIPNRHIGQFQKGVRPVDRFGEERWAEICGKRHDSLELTRRRERARAVWCLPQRTKLRVEREPKAKTCQRMYLRRHGYIMEGRNAYYTDTTHRCHTIEKRKRWFIFMPADNINIKEQTL